MRVLAVLFCVVLLCTSGMQAQQALPNAPEASAWQPVRDLPAGVSLHLKTTTRGLTCRVKSVDASSLTCANADTTTFQSREVTSITQVHRGRSALVGSLIGVGAGAIIGAAVGSSCSAQQKNSFLGCFTIVSRGELALIGAVVYGVIGAPVGYFTDFTRTRVYKRH
ncbi:MAG: hypothetical protein M3O02_02215 [Acidobacteriota bacterium]|nr:hypothetical protein [Acidobacteriota bacterium]